MEYAWKLVFFCGVILHSVFNAGNCQQVCRTLDECTGSTEFSQYYYKKFYEPSSVDYDPSDICEKSNPVKAWCSDRSEAILQEDAICGHVISEEIITGPKTRINEFPWMALLQYTNGKTVETSCQGVLITNELVMTSAACITRNTNGFNLTSVRLGEWDKSTVIDCDNSTGFLICNNPPVVVPIESTRVDTYFVKTPAHWNNIGLIRLRHKVEFTDFIKPICVPKFVFYQTDRQFAVGRKFEIASWGETSPTGKKSEILLKVDLKGFTCPSDSTHICIQGTRRRNVCDGDEGAPIMGRTMLGNRTYVYLTGIVSNNNSCGTSEGPIFFVDRVGWS